MLVPAVLAVPGLLGLGRETALDTVSSFVAGIPLLHGALVLPIETARNIGDALLAGRIVMLGGAGIASATLLRTLGLAGTALIGGVLTECAAVSNGTTGWQALAGLLVCPLFVACVERAVRGLRPSVLRLAVAISLVASFGSATFVLAFGAAWAGGRIASGGTHRARACSRLAVAALLGALLASPLVFLRALRGELALGDLSDWLAFWPSGAAGRAGFASAGLTLLPCAGLACLAAVPAVRRGMVARVLLALPPIAVAVLAWLPSGGAVALEDLWPLCLTCVVVLCCVSLADQARREASAGWCVAVGSVLLSACVASAVLDRVPVTPAVVSATLLVAALTLAARTRGLWAAAPVLVSAGWGAVARIAHP